jgi:hypothetical protein
MSVYPIHLWDEDRKHMVLVGAASNFISVASCEVVAL